MTPTPDPDTSPCVELLRGRLMQHSLRGLLDRVPGSRRAMPHLAALERALGRRGAGAIDRIPPPFVGRVFRQLRVLPLSDDDEALQDLILRLLRAVRRARSAQTRQLQPLDPDATVVVMDGSHSDFMDAMSELHAPPPAGSLPPRWADTAPAPLAPYAG